MAFGDDATLTATVNGSRVDLVLNATGMTGLSVFQDAPGGRIYVRGAIDTAPTGVGLWAGADVEPPQGKIVKYGAEITDGVTTFTVPSVNTDTTVDYGGDFIMPVGQPTLGMNVLIERGGMGTLTRDVVQDVRSVLNRPSPVVVNFGRRYFQGRITFLTLTSAEAGQLEAILAYPVLMFVTRPGYGFSDPVYLALGKAEEERTSPLGWETSRRWIVDVTQVDRPPADYPYFPVGTYWQEILDAPHTWQTFLDDHVDWYEAAGFAG